MENGCHVRLIVIPAQAVVLPGHAAAVTETARKRLLFQRLRD